MAKKSKKNAPPRYVNLGISVVTVFDETKRNVRVAPWHMRGRGNSGIFVVEGGHYQQFVSGRGPLHPFPAGEALPDSGVMDSLGKRLAAKSPEARDLGAPVPSRKAASTSPDPADQGSDVDDEEDAAPEGDEGDGEGQDGDDAGAGDEDTGDGDPDGEDDDAGSDDDEDAKAPSKRSLADRVLGRNKKKAAKKKAAKKKAAKKKKG